MYNRTHLMFMLLIAASNTMYAAQESFICPETLKAMEELAKEAEADASSLVAPQPKHTPLVEKLYPRLTHLLMFPQSDASRDPNAELAIIQAKLKANKEKALQAYSNPNADAHEKQMAVLDANAEHFALKREEARWATDFNRDPRGDDHDDDDNASNFGDYSVNIPNDRFFERHMKPHLPSREVTEHESEQERKKQ